MVRGAQGGNRTLNPLRATDFKSVAYTSSATWANEMYIFCCSRYVYLFYGVSQPYFLTVRPVRHSLGAEGSFSGVESLSLTQSAFIRFRRANFAFNLYFKFVQMFLFVLWRKPDEALAKSGGAGGNSTYGRQANPRIAVLSCLRQISRRETDRSVTTSTYFLEVQAGIEPAHRGFADRSVTTSPLHH